MSRLQKLAKALLLSLLFSPCYLFSQSIFLDSDMDSTLLDSDQLENYQKISHNEEFVGYRLIAVQDLLTVQAEGRIIIELPDFPCPQLSFLARNVDYIDQDNYTWYGEIVNESDDPCNEGTLFLMA